MPIAVEKEKKTRKRRLTAPEVVRLQKMCRDRLVSDLYAQKAYPGMPISGARTLSDLYEIPLSVVRSTLDSLRTEGVLEGLLYSAKQFAQKNKNGLRKNIFIAQTVLT